MNIIVRIEGRPGSPNQEYWYKSILLDTTNIQAHKSRCTCEEAVLTKMDQLSLPPRHASDNSTVRHGTNDETH